MFSAFQAHYQCCQTLIEALVCVHSVELAHVTLPSRYVAVRSEHRLAKSVTFNTLTHNVCATCPRSSSTQYSRLMQRARHIFKEDGCVSLSFPRVISTGFYEFPINCATDAQTFTIKLLPMKKHLIIFGTCIVSLITSLLRMNTL